MAPLLLWDAFGAYSRAHPSGCGLKESMGCIAPVQGREGAARRKAEKCERGRYRFCAFGRGNCVLGSANHVWKTCLESKYFVVACFFVLRHTSIKRRFQMFYFY